MTKVEDKTMNEEVSGGRIHKHYRCSNPACINHRGHFISVDSSKPCSKCGAPIEVYYD